MATTTKKKAATKKAPVDLIVSVAHEVENMDKDTAYATAEGLDQEIEFNYFKLGGILARIHTEQWYIDDGFEKFPEFVEARFGVRRSKAFHLIGIYNGLIESGVAWEDVSEVGWSKLKELVNVITPKNVKGWVKRAKDLTLLQLIDYIKKQQQKGEAGTTGAEPSEDESKKISSLVFKVHADQRELIEQAVEKAKAETGSEYPAVALEAISMSYLAGPTTAKDEKAAPAKAVKATEEGLKDYMENFTWEDVLGVFEKIWPDVDITVETE